MVSSAPGAMVAASGSHTPMGIIRAEPSNDIGSGAIEARPRSKVWILFGVLLAAVIGGGLGMLAFQWTAPESRASATAPAAPSALPAPATSALAAKPQESAAPAVVPTPAAAAVEPKQVVLKVTTDPAGASIREDGREICVATPCDLVFKGEAADAAKLHKLLIMRGGFRPETPTGKTSDPPGHVKRSHAGGGTARVVRRRRPSRTARR
jgi:hypothetical protein